MVARTDKRWVERDGGISSWLLPSMCSYFLGNGTPKNRNPNTPILDTKFITKTEYERICSSFHLTIRILNYWKWKIIYLICRQYDFNRFVTGFRLHISFVFVLSWRVNCSLFHSSFVIVVVLYISSHSPFSFEGHSHIYIDTIFWCHFDQDNSPSSLSLRAGSIVRSSLVYVFPLRVFVATRYESSLPLIDLVTQSAVRKFLFVYFR